MRLVISVLSLTTYYLLILPYSISFSIQSPQKTFYSKKLQLSITSDITKTKNIPYKNKEQIETISSELLSLVLNRWNTGSKQNDIQIDNLMNVLIESNTKFDPKTSLVDTFYATLYTSGAAKEPLWKTIAEVFSNTNIQGQKYIAGEEENEGYIVNYSEILGKDVHLCAYGTFEKNDNTLDLASSTLKNENISNPFMKFFQSKVNTRSSSRLECPVDYTAIVKEAELLFFGKKLSIPIAGIGTVRVLYADPQLRIFISPNDNTDSRWEKAGLKVIQVRIDLIDNDLKYWKDLSNPNEL